MKKKDQTPTLLKLVQWGFPKLEKIAPALADRLFVKIFFSPLRYRVPEKEKEIIRAAEKFEVEAAGKRIQCYAWGNGPVVLFVHGWAGRAGQFRKLILALTQHGYRAVGFDGPAHGKSEGKNTNIIEFKEALEKIYAKEGTPVALIAHSFGGGAVLYSAMTGLTVKRLINIASPTIGDEIINTYLRTINGSSRTGETFKKYIVSTYGKPFHEFTALYFVKHLQQKIALLLVHDEDDLEVTIQHPHELKKLYPPAQLFITKGLGHTRILKDDAVIDRCVTFIKEGASG
ncbi:MAG: alpha/beta hydrolase [Bacteroidota bacterium]